MILIDYREAKSGILEYFKNNKISLKLKKLVYGDYVIHNDVVIERKTADDFIKSIINGRIFMQTINMIKHYEYTLIIIEGNPFNTMYKINKESIVGALLELNIILNTQVMFTNSVKGTFDRLLAINKYYIKYKNKTTKRYGYKPKKTWIRQLYILQGFPMIGQVLSKRLLNHFGSIKNFINADKKELMAVKGINKIISEKILKIINKKL